MTMKLDEQPVRATLDRYPCLFSAPDWLAALTAHIPNAGEHLVRYYGWYSNVSRGKRRKTQGEGPITIEEFPESPPRPQSARGHS
jgi:hypothetical protein